MKLDRALTKKSLTDGMVLIEGMLKMASPAEVIMTITTALGLMIGSHIDPNRTEETLDVVIHNIRVVAHAALAEKE